MIPATQIWNFSTLLSVFSKLSSVLAKLKAPLSQPCAEDKIRHRGKEER